jgi:hypothetical protein
VPLTRVATFGTHRSRALRSAGLSLCERDSDKPEWSEIVKGLRGVLWGPRHSGGRDLWPVCGLWSHRPRDRASAANVMVLDQMRENRAIGRTALAVVALALLLALSAMAGRASAATSCSAIPTVYGIPPWGFHTGSYTGERSFAKGHGNINLEASTVSGVICQQDRAGTIIMSVEHHLVFHSHVAVMWGFPGNIIKIKVRVQTSNDPQCEVGTIGHATLFASYNGVRSDSVQFFFPGACNDQDRLYHGTQVNNQVPPL